MQMIGAPVSAESFDVTPEQMRTTFMMTKDIRDKYIASRLLWDLGLLEEAAQQL
jgi:glycerol-1-phosphate dehydrogenase [NAD(P)+]